MDNLVDKDNFFPLFNSGKQKKEATQAPAHTRVDKYRKKLSACPLVHSKEMNEMQIDEKTIEKKL
jgi:hypothetical protein